MKPCISLLFLVIFLTSCNNKKSEDIILVRNTEIKYDKDGILKYIKIKSQSDSSKTINILFNKTGGVDTIQQDISSKHDGQFISFYPNGIIESTNLFKLNKENGFGFRFYSDGAIKLNDYWSDGKLSGYCTYYFNGSYPLPKAIIKLSDNGTLEAMKEVAYPNGPMRIIPFDNLDTIKNHLELLHSLK